MKESIYNLWTKNNNDIFLVNTLYKGIIKIEKNEEIFIKNILTNNIKKAENNKIIKYRDILYQNGFMIDSSKDELKILEHKFNIYHNSTEYLEITLIPTYKCNFKCIYCFETDDTTSRWNAELVNRLKVCSKELFKNKKLIKLSLFGGEPMLEWKLLKEYLNYINILKNKYNFELELSITTNGYLIDNNKYIRELIDIYKIGAIQITIDCAEKYHDKRRILKNNNGTYKKIISNTRKIINYIVEHHKKTQLHLRINLLNNSADDIIPLLNEFNNQEKEYMKIFFRAIWNTKKFTVSNSNLDNDLHEFYDVARKSGYNFFRSENEITYSFCEAGIGLNFIHINPDLSIWKCTNDLEIDKVKLGYINETGKLIIDNKKVNEINKSSPFNDSKCKLCKYLPMCWGGCLLSFLNDGYRQCPEFTKKDGNIINYMRSN